jgi:Ni,Fe-hydrogenase maturation factor
MVIFVDAAFNPGDAVEVRRLKTDADPPPLGHTSDPRELLALTQAIHGRCPEAWLVTIPAVRLDFADELSPTTNRAAAGALLDIARLIAEKRDP